MGSISLPQPQPSLLLFLERNMMLPQFMDHLYSLNSKITVDFWTTFIQKTTVILERREYSALKRNGIISFRDDDSLETGKATAPAVLEAIQDSWCSIIVISGAYVFSSRCLSQLAQIVERRNEGELKVFTVYDHLDPSDIRRQTGKVQEAFAKHDKETTQKWRSALTQVANIGGWSLYDDRNESAVIDDTVEIILAKLSQTYPSIPELIGIDSCLNELHSIIGIGGRDIRAIGICGMGVTGNKTTIARVVNTQMSPHFDVSKKVGLVSLQKQLLYQIFPGETFNFIDVHEGIDMITRRLSGKKVLLVIDDVDNMQQLNWLVQRPDDNNQFRLGSRIIITTRDEHSLRSHQVDGVYKPKMLNIMNEALLELFVLKAFNNETVLPDDFVELSKHLVEYADGLPLALEVLGSLFRGRDGDQWRAGLQRVTRVSVEEILDPLKISYDGLAETEQHFFIHKLPKNRVNSECIFLPINLILEILLLALQQCASPRKPIFSLIAMILSFVAMFICIIELFGRGRKAKFAFKRQGSNRCRFQPQSPAEKPTCSYIDMFVFLCAFIQFIFSIVAYYFHQLHRENPIKVSVVSIIFIVCTALSSYIHSQNDLPLPLKRDHDV